MPTDAEELAVYKLALRKVCGYYAASVEDLCIYLDEEAEAHNALAVAREELAAGGGDPLFIPSKSEWQTAEIALSPEDARPHYWNGMTWVPLPNAQRKHKVEWTWDIPEDWQPCTVKLDEGEVTGYFAQIITPDGFFPVYKTPGGGDQ